MNITSLLTKLALLLIVVLGAGAYYGWQQYKPIGEVLKEKDPVKYDLMVEEAKSFHIKEARKLFDELEAMSREDVIYLRYNQWKERRKADKEFRLSNWEEQLDERTGTDKARRLKHDKDLLALIDLGADKQGDLRREDWRNAETWRKSMILREKCIKYLNMEDIDSRRRKNALELSRISSLLDRPKKASWSIPEYCADIVPVTHDEEIVMAAVRRLKGEMNYYYYIKLLDEIGIPTEDREFPQQLEGLAGYFTDS